ncbi:MAG: hypothetical protein HW411_155 [Gammaproteobacteria bacterium]|nr:hypothetical protein [Gammaproteobacteria bacterium]
MIHRPIYFLYLALYLASASLQAQEEVTNEVPDPALEAVQALGIEGANEPAAGTDIAPEQAAPEEIIESPPAVETDAITAESPVQKDVVLVLDNSGSMKKNDPQFIAKQAVVEFIGGLDEATRVAVIIFDQTVRLAVPMTQMSDATRTTILQSLDQINYKGLFTDSPAAIERAIYELKTNGREDAQKIIVFMTDGIVDTGNADQDLEKAKWLKDELAADAAESAIRIFGIAYTENADFHLIQSIAQDTNGEYYRVLQAEELKNVFAQVYTLINKRPEPEVIAPEPVQPPPQPVEVAPPQPVIIEVPVQTQAMDEEERLRSMMILVALAVLIIAVIIMVMMLIRGSRKKAGDEEYAQEAYLNDTNGYTKQAAYKLGNIPTMLGRVAGKDTEHLNYIVIPETTIGRRHALIEYKDFAYWIVDQGSINGTFVNDQLISSEVRLKHGDRIRLHKLEFEFIMPEMVDAGMTVISKTVFGGQTKGTPDEQTIARSTGGAAQSAMDETDLPEPDFNLDTDIPSALGPDSDEEDTVIKGSPAPEPDDDGGGDETIMLDDDGNETQTPQSDDATIRPDESLDDITVDNFMDIDDESEKGHGKK